MNNQLKLQKFLVDILGSKNVYFQPTSNIMMSYPAIVYSLNEISNEHANDLVYKQDRSYTLTVIDKRPNSEIVDKISMLPRCTFDTAFTKEGLNHTIFNLYY